MGLLSDFFDAITGNEKDDHDDRIREVLSEGNYTYKKVLFDKTTGEIIEIDD